ncbi:phosphopantetheine-binding protein [Parachryseolinea silvisoli]|jgi:acyl carrier protein|uniref:phosphopantetheine-binding protein n=1 Tax=Parachryseolinea silvisoli TaxID=2873601 RepID=UPI002265875C|nr:phosphopantetheine-binding protein [Parachryseolinea silvisoli]MCD9014566.1 acyl carrier protein [Parachryseolinea silvisoli]
MEQLMADLKRQIIEALNLKHLTPAEIGDDQPLFGEGLGLDSIDALELIVLLQQQYKVKIDNPQDGPKIFRSVRTIAEFITAHKPA